MEIRPLDAALGTEVAGIELADGVDDAAFAALHEAWIDRGLLVFRGQHFGDAALVAISRRFGDLDLPPASERAARGEAADDVPPEVWVIANGTVDGRPIGALGAGEAEWHTDMSYLPEPPAASLLHALTVPTAAGHTSFANMTAALAALPAALRGAIDGRHASHDATYTSVGERRKGTTGACATGAGATGAGATGAPATLHPIVRTHPVSRRPALYLGRRRNAAIAGLARADSERLLDALWAFCTEPRFVYRHEWRPGDLLVWDNRATIHRRDAFDPGLRRVMHRTQVKGDRPY